MKNLINFSLAGTLLLASAGAYSAVVDTFGVNGSTADLSTDYSETLSVDLFGSTGDAAGNTLTNVQVIVQSSVSTQGSATNSTGTSADVNAQVLSLSQWDATTNFAGINDVVFEAAFTTLLDAPLGVINPGDTVNFGPITNDTGALVALNSSAPAILAAFSAAGSLDFLFDTQLATLISGGSNFDSSFITAGFGRLEVIYTFTPDQPSGVPVPAAVWLFGTGLVGLMGATRRKKA